MYNIKFEYLDSLKMKNLYGTKLTHKNKASYTSSSAGLSKINSHWWKDTNSIFYVSDNSLI